MMLASEILKRTPLTEKQQQKVDQIYRNGQQAISLIDNQLVMAKIESGFLSVEYAEVDLALMIQDILEEFQLLADKYGVFGVTDFPDQTRLINSDKNLLKRIVENLLANAIKFSKSGQKIIIRLEYPPEMKVRLSVIDEGEGVSDELKNIIFNRFVVGHSFNDTKQMGLGLAFCKLAIEALGGNILVQDNQPQGVIFILEI
jgi:signal transduction histidine kinase